MSDEIRAGWSELITSRNVVDLATHRAMRMTAQRFEPSQMRSWEADKPWNLSPADAEAQMVPGWWGKSSRGTESASWEKGYIRPCPEFFTYPEQTRRAIAYHEAGHAMIEAAGGLAIIAAKFKLDLFGMDEWFGATTLGYNSEEIIAEGYSVLWCEPSWFEGKSDQLKVMIIRIAQMAHFPLPSGVTASLAKLAQSWRGLTDGPIWAWYPGVIIVDKGGGNRQTYEVYVDGDLQPRAQRLQEAKDYIERKLGPCDWVMLKPEPQKVDHYWLGPTTAFTDPVTVYSAIPRV